MISTDESSIGVWLWLVMVVLFNVTWISFDLWLRANGHEYLTTEFREGLHNPVLGPFVAGITAFTIVAFCVHMWNVK